MHLLLGPADSLFQLQQCQGAYSSLAFYAAVISVYYFWTVSGSIGLIGSLCRGSRLCVWWWSGKSREALNPTLPVVFICFYV